MYGVTRNLPIRQFHGARLTELRSLENVFYFVFERPRAKLSLGRRPRPLSIGIEGSWQLRRADSSPVAEGSPIPESGLQAARALIGEAVVASEVKVPKSFTLTLSSGHVLEVFDSNQKYESFSIPESNVYV